MKMNNKKPASVQVNAGFWYFQFRDFNPKSYSLMFGFSSP